MDNKMIYEVYLVYILTTYNLVDNTIISSKV